MFEVLPLWMLEPACQEDAESVGLGVVLQRLRPIRRGQRLAFIEAKIEMHDIKNSIHSVLYFIDVLWVLLLCNRIKWQFIVIQIQILSNAKCYTILVFPR